MFSSMCFFGEPDCSSFSLFCCACCLVYTDVGRMCRWVVYRVVSGEEEDGRTRRKSCLPHIHSFCLSQANGRALFIEAEKGVRKEVKEQKDEEGK